MNKPTISVIIPNYNSGKYLERAVNSVMMQSYHDWEIIIVDNNSSDQSSTYLRRLKHTKVRIFQIENKGIIAASRNMGLSMADGQWVAFLDADDWWMSDKLEVCVKSMPNYDIIYHNMYIVSDSNRTQMRKTRCRNLSAQKFTDLLFGGNTLCTSSVLVRKSIFEQIRYFRVETRFRAWEDYDAWLRIALKNAKFKFEQRILGFYWQAGGNTLNARLQIKNTLTFKKEYYKHIMKHVDKKLWWTDYTLALCHNRLNNYPIDYKYALRSYQKANNYREIIRSIYMILKAKFFRI